MKMKIVTVGKVKEGFVRQGIQHYGERLATSKFELIELGVQARTPAEERTKAAAVATAALSEQDYRIILDGRGKQLSSPDFAALISRQMTRGHSSFAFLIGGPNGWDESFFKTAHFVLSLSTMTMPSQLACLVLAEQMYRSFEILRGSPYHH